MEQSHAMQRNSCIPDPLEWVALCSCSTQLTAVLHTLHTARTSSLLVLPAQMRLNRQTESEASRWAICAGSCHLDEINPSGTTSQNDCPLLQGRLLWLPVLHQCNTASLTTVCALERTIKVLASVHEVQMNGEQYLCTGTCISGSLKLLDDSDIAPALCYD